MHAHTLYIYQLSFKKIQTGCLLHELVSRDLKILYGSRLANTYNKKINNWIKIKLN